MLDTIKSVIHELAMLYIKNDNVRIVCFSRTETR